MKWAADLQLFATSYTVTVYKDAGFSAFSASPASGEKNTEVTLTITPATGYELDEIEVIGGGVEVNLATKKFKIGEANVVLYAKSKANNLFKVTEECRVNVNDGTWQTLHRNVTLQLTPAGGISGANCDGSALTVNAGIQALIDQGIIVKI